MFFFHKYSIQQLMNQTHFQTQDTKKQQKITQKCFKKNKSVLWKVNQNKKFLVYYLLVLHIQVKQNIFFKSILLKIRVQNQQQIKMYTRIYKILVMSLYTVKLQIKKRKSQNKQKIFNQKNKSLVLFFAILYNLVEVQIIFYKKMQFNVSVFMEKFPKK
ncbi:hypothetical protein IMG5_030670 [Ichthyophthirius multifiliis]|uniref:Transmembrane protein n=1 Tax=Ichthyophthirius multifiliis TaxID=5932 RepID=G0QLH7_ICHMU|nr:hypothetical protein IMG5_030670 [Ichthyophthirius multifiliis]EGR33925.1 hypothetical protein IMG5_030670 [Ichthyophthirius multifiliis]|eukprot:XP_004039229.1 hypothetical protein IMG5_030670 [Ichthyophthirius multifiliis]